MAGLLLLDAGLDFAFGVLGVLAPALGEAAEAKEVEAFLLGAAFTAVDLVFGFGGI